MSRTDVFLDLECIPACDWYMAEAAAKVAPPANYKDPAVISKWWETKGVAAKEDAMAKTVFQPLYGQIHTIAWAVEGGKVQSVSTGTQYSEASILTQFFLDVRAALPAEVFPRIRWIGHNIHAFDLPYLRTRMLVNKVNADSLLPDKGVQAYDTTELFDTLYQMAGREPRGYSLGNVCRVFGIKTSDVMDGSMVWGMAREGMHDAIAAYCREDVESIRQLFNRLQWATAT